MTSASGTITAGTEAYGFYISTAGSRFTASGSYATPYQAVPTKGRLFIKFKVTPFSILDLYTYFAASVNIFSIIFLGTSA